eukprot:CAMPEP_0116994856 /NCGR_PEP_ID=MMETSP0467-20121206/68397_1 /TAXON_ID=283647 /ORGANISM="Mesodinium pulex, Strain SPMC105" /LENGTH=220 /DNA_ID=CAMNT_0004693039 /DNA_START=888 /DNA_END=1546 /DNA_ORIENTATION=-
MISEIGAVTLEEDADVVAHHADFEGLPIPGADFELGLGGLAVDGLAFLDVLQHEHRLVLFNHNSHPDLGLAVDCFHAERQTAVVIVRVEVQLLLALVPALDAFFQQSTRWVFLIGDPGLFHLRERLDGAVEPFHEHPLARALGRLHVVQCDLDFGGITPGLWLQLAIAELRTQCHDCGILGLETLLVHDVDVVELGSKAVVALKPDRAVLQRIVEHVQEW